jgi:hypothetical protein
MTTDSLQPRKGNGIGARCSTNRFTKNAFASEMFSRFGQRLSAAIQSLYVVPPALHIPAKFELSGPEAIIPASVGNSCYSRVSCLYYDRYYSPIRIGKFDRYLERFAPNVTPYTVT